MSDDDTRPDFLGAARSLGRFKQEAESSMRRQMFKRKEKESKRPTKFCEICETTFDFRKKPNIIVSEGHEPVLKTGRCTQCKKEIKDGFVAVKLRALEPETIWLKRNASMTNWPDCTTVEDTKLFETLKAKVQGEKVDTSEYEQKLQNKDQPEGPSE